MPKRRRNATASGRRPKLSRYGTPYERVRPATRRFVAGFDRTGGYYGRYANGGELKFHDVDLDDATIATGVNVTATVNIIPQGVTESDRVGRMCTIKSIGWRYRVSMPTIATLSSDDTVRVIMYLDKQANGATIGTTDLLETADFQSFNNLSNSKRFRILHDKVYAMNYRAGGGDGTANDAAPFGINATFFKKCNIPIEFSSTTGAIGEIRSNNIGVLLISEAGVAGFNSKIRLRFSDN